MNTQSRKEQEKIARKNEIMEAGLQLFAEKDYHEVTVDEIAERVGLSKGTLYLYFKNKEDLFFSIVQDKADLFYERLHATIARDQSFADCLHGFVYTFLSFFHRFLNSNRSLGQAFTQAPQAVQFSSVTTGKPDSGSI